MLGWVRRPSSRPSRRTSPVRTITRQPRSWLHASYVSQAWPLLSSSSSWYRFMRPPPPRVAPALREQLVVTSALDHPALVEHDDQVGVAREHQVVRDDDR